MKFVVTDEFIDEGRSIRGGWTARQFAILGLIWPPQEGWRRQVIGLEIDRAAGDEFLALKEGSNRH